MRACRLTIEGRVQGVGFRDGLRREALRANVRGWVRNRFDGSVEALIIGEDAAIAALIGWCGRGPSSATVARIDVTELDPSSCESSESFQMRPTC